MALKMIVMDKPTITFEEFLEEWNNFVSPTKNKYLRKGQALMNYLYEVWREEYLRLTNTSLDCFYRDDIIPKTIDHLQQIWK